MSWEKNSCKVHNILPPIEVIDIVDVCIIDIAASHKEKLAKGPWYPAQTQTGQDISTYHLYRNRSLLITL